MHSVEQRVRQHHITAVNHPRWADDVISHNRPAMQQTTCLTDIIIISGVTPRIFCITVICAGCWINKTNQLELGSWMTDSISCVRRAKTTP